MSDLISREAALNATKMVYVECLIIDKDDYDEGIADDMSVAFASDIKKIPAVDAAKVVRCKDCIRWYEREQVCLKIYSDSGCHYSAWQERKPDDFCSYGERKDNETD